MTKDKKILVGVCVGGYGGIDKYVLHFTKVCKKYNIHCDVLTTKWSDDFDKQLTENNANLIQIANLHNKSQIYKKINDLCKQNDYSASYWNISTDLMFPYIDASFKSRVENILVHGHAHYNNRSNILENKIFDLLHYFYRTKLNKLPVKYAGCSNDSAMWVGGKKTQGNNWTFIPNPVNTKLFKYNENLRNLMRAQLELGNKFVVGSVTSYMYYKNPMWLIDVVSSLQKRNKNTMLVVAGEGPLKDNFIKTCEHKLLPNSFKILGKRDDVEKLMQAFDVYMLPSHNEGLPISVLEAQCCGLECFISDSITSEVIAVKDNVHRISLKKGADYWANEILQNKCKPRNKDAYNLVDKAGFNLDSPKIALKSLNLI